MKTVLPEEELTARHECGAQEIVFLLKFQPIVLPFPEQALFPTLPLSCFTQGIVVVQSPSHAQFFATPWTAACQAFLSLTISLSLPKFVLIESMMPSSHLHL